MCYYLVVCETKMDGRKKKLSIEKQVLFVLLARTTVRTYVGEKRVGTGLFCDGVRRRCFTYSHYKLLAARLAQEKTLPPSSTGYFANIYNM